MAISTYEELKTAIANWLHRSDLTSRIPEFITLAESRLNTELIVGKNIATTTVSTSTSTRFASLPSRCLEVKTIADHYGNALSLRSAHDVAVASVSSVAGLPEYYAITSQIEFERVSDQVYSMTVTHKQSLSIEADTTNWLLTAHPDVYLYASLYQAAPFLLGDARLPTLGALAKEAIDAVNGQYKQRPPARVDPALVRGGSFDINRG